MTAISKQIGGNHYKDFAIQPIEFIHRNDLGFEIGNVIKYVCRFKQKMEMQDLEKAKHYIELMIELSEEFNIKDNKNIIFCHDCTGYHIFSETISGCKCLCHEEMKNV